MKSSNLNSVNSGDTQSQSSRPRPRYAGNITMQMIDDYFNPISKNKDKTTTLNQIKFTTESATNGLGLAPIDKNNQMFGGKSVTGSSSNVIVPFAERMLKDHNDNFEYVNHMRKTFENELKFSSMQESDKSFYPESIANTEEKSVVGSAMSQIGNSINLNPFQKFFSFQFVVDSSVSCCLILNLSTSLFEKTHET